MTSLKNKLLLRLSVLITATLIVVGSFAYSSVDNSINKNYDAQLITDCNLLWLLTKEEIKEEDNKPPEELDAESTIKFQSGKYQESLELYGNWHSFRVWKGNKILISSDNAPRFSILKEGLSDINIKGHTWRAYSLHIPEFGATVEAFEDLESRKIVENNILFELIIPLLFIIPVVGFMLSYGINNGLNGLKRFANQVAGRSPDDLSPLEELSTPRELKPLMNSLNGLFVKLADLLNREREFIDNAAHALRTPITALKIQGNLLQESKNKNDREEAIKDINLGINRVAKLIKQLLVLSKLDNNKTELTTVNLYTEVRNVLIDVSAVALDKKIELSLEGDENIFIKSDSELLKILIISIVENAVKYTSIGGRVKLNINDNTLEIEDNGVGIAPNERDKVFYRFYRINNSSEQGSGLGLAIAKSIADVFAATINISEGSDGIGTKVTIIFSK